MEDTDVSFRVNVITLTGEGEYEDLIITDHSSGEITTPEADKLIKALQAEFQNDELTYRMAKHDQEQPAAEEARPGKKPAAE